MTAIIEEQKTCELINDTVVIRGIVEELGQYLLKRWRKFHISYYSIEPGECLIKLRGSRKCKVTVYAEKKAVRGGKKFCDSVATVLETTLQRNQKTLDELQSCLPSILSSLPRLMEAYGFKSERIASVSEVLVHLSGIPFARSCTEKHRLETSELPSDAFAQRISSENELLVPPYSMASEIDPRLFQEQG